MSAWLTMAEGIVTAAIPVVGLIYTNTVNRRAQYDRILALTEQAVTPPVADDRHTAGTAFEPLSKHPPGQPVRLSKVEIRAIFNVLWYFQRASAMYISLRPTVWPTRITRTQALLLDSIAPALDIWIVYLGLAWVDQAGRKVDATENTRGLRHLASEHARLLNRRSKSPASASLACCPSHLLVHPARTLRSKAPADCQATNVPLGGDLGMEADDAIK